MIEHHFVDSRIKEHLLLAVTASNWAESLLSPRSYQNSVMEQKRNHKSIVEKPRKVKRQLNVRARYYSKVSMNVILGYLYVIVMQHHTTVIVTMVTNFRWVCQWKSKHQQVRRIM